MNELLNDNVIGKLKLMNLETNFRFEIFYLYYAQLYAQDQFQKLEEFASYFVKEYEEKAK